MTDAEWAEMEAAWAEEQVMRLANVRVRGYTLACCDAVRLAKRNAEAAAERLERAKADAEHALRTLSKTLEQAELAARVVTSGDDGWILEVAGHLAEVFG